MGRWSDGEIKPKTAAAGKTIVETIENVCNCMCDSYCKYREQSWENEEKIAEICNICPLNLLQ